MGNGIIFYDQNFISIEGDTQITYTDDVQKRMEAYDWHVQDIDGHNHAEIAAAIEYEFDVKIQDLSAAKTAFRSISALADHVATAQGAGG